MAEYVKTKSAVVVHRKDGTAIAVDGGAVFETSALADYVVDGLDTAYGKNLFEGASKKEHDAYASGRYGAGDVVADSMTEVEALSKERASYSAEERHGIAPVDPGPPPRMDAGRTLPENGADRVADRAYAEGSGDTSEAGKDRIAQILDAGGEVGEASEKASEAPTADGADTPGAPEPSQSGGSAAKARGKAAEEKKE
jgi:hypothetical protein